VEGRATARLNSRAERPIIRLARPTKRPVPRPWGISAREKRANPFATGNAWPIFLLSPIAWRDLYSFSGAKWAGRRYDLELLPISVRPFR